MTRSDNNPAVALESLGILDAFEIRTDRSLQVDTDLQQFVAPSRAYRR